MFIFKKAEPATYSSEATNAEFKFRQSNDEERRKLFEYIDFEKRIHNDENLWVDYLLNQDGYYAAWLLKDFSNVQQDGKALGREQFDLAERAGLLRKLKEADSKFSEWFKAHCEPPEKKIEEVAAGGEVVDAGTVPAVQGP